MSSEAPANDTQNASELIWRGGPLIRKPGTSRAEFSAAWRNHGLLAVPMFEKSQIVNYFQVHLPEDLAESAGIPGDGIAVLLVRSKPPAPQEAAAEPPSRYYSEVILPDERRFLHDESGSSPVKREPPSFDLPKKDVTEWYRLALEAGAVEYKFIEDGKTLVDVPADVRNTWDILNAAV